MNYYDCWDGVHCGSGDWGTPLFIAKWGGTLGGTVFGTFVGSISGPAGQAMISMQVKQTEQASIQAAFNLVGSLSGMYAPLYFTKYYFDTSCEGWHCIRFAFFGYAIQFAASISYVIAWAVDRYLNAVNKSRFVVPKHGVEGIHGMSTLDVQRQKLVGKIPGRLNPGDGRGVSSVRLSTTNARISLSFLSRFSEVFHFSHVSLTFSQRVRRRGGEHEIAEHVDAQRSTELQPLLSGSE